jgi:phospholipase C
MPLVSIASRALPVAAFALSLCACSAGGGPATAPGLPIANTQSAPQAAPDRRHGSSKKKIKHIVIIVQENRSFNNLFYGFKGATTVGYGYDSNNQKVNLIPVGLETSWDIEHDSSGYFAACNGTGSVPGTNCQMNGFNREFAGCYNSCPSKEPEYAYVPRTETKPYFDMGRQYVLADQMYASNFDASSFISHQYIISGQAEKAVNFPYSSWGCPGGMYDRIQEVGPDRQIPDGSEVVCWDPTTLGDELDKAGVSWAFYTSPYYGDGGIWSAYQAINHIYNGPDWKTDIITPQTQIFNDITNGTLRSVNWVTPTCANSDHAGCGSNTGPSWVTSVVNAIGESPYWSSTAIFVFWDDYGGWYDSQAPAYADFDGLGMRIPMLIISPYAKRGHVSHVHYEHGTILKFVEDTFGLPRLAASDTRAAAPDDAFNFKKAPRAFVPIQSPYDLQYFKHQPADLRIPDWE